MLTDTTQTHNQLRGPGFNPGSPSDSIILRPAGMSPLFVYFSVTHSDEKVVLAYKRAKFDSRRRNGAEQITKPFT